MTNNLNLPQALSQEEINEWMQALDDVIANSGGNVTKHILENLLDRARQAGLIIPYGVNTPYINTIHHSQERPMPGDPNLDHEIRAITRWNALAMVVKANKISSELGGHIASFASCATLYDVGYNHFWRGPEAEGGADLIYFQGHASPGNYARSFIEGRLSEEQLDFFRREVEAEGKGLSSYPHPWLMPDYWQFPTVSMGLGPIMAIYQARFLKYLMARELIPQNNRNVWAFLGDGECDEPESLGAIAMAGREKLGNLIFVINCNLQRLDGPVRGNGKIIQELEGVFTGAGWNVIKVIWGSRWDPLLDNDTDGLLKKRMDEVVDGEYQNLKSASSGEAVRERFFGEYPELKKRVAHLSDEEVWELDRGGHDPKKVYAAYLSAVECTDKPTVILAKTIKGYGMGEAGEGQNRTHQQKKLVDEEIITFKNRFKIPINDEDAKALKYIRPAESEPAMKYMRQSRQALGGYIPQRKDTAPTLEIPAIDMFEKLMGSSNDKELSTTMVFTRILTTMLRIPQFKDIIVPIIPDEARTFGMEGFFRQLGIYSSVGQLYTPQDQGQVMYYREDKKGQILEEGINEAGAFSSWIAASCSTYNHGINTIPLYIFYSMFGTQRVGDLFWAAGDMRCRGFLLGATAGRTTLAGEGLQHQDGFSLLSTSGIPNCKAWDPCFSYELAVIIHQGLKEMYRDKQSCFYYITLMNENYAHPAMPEGKADDIIQGLYLLQQSSSEHTTRVQLMGSGTILNEVIAAADILEKEYQVSADIWSIPGLNQAARQAQDCRRWNTLHPNQPPRLSHIDKCFSQRSVEQDPLIVATDYVRAYPEQIREFIPCPKMVVLGTDGFGRSDRRKILRHHFEVSREFIVVHALKSLVELNKLDVAVVEKAIKTFGIDPDKPNPITV